MRPKCDFFVNRMTVSSAIWLGREPRKFYGRGSYHWYRQGLTGVSLFIYLFLDRSFL